VRGAGLGLQLVRPFATRMKTSTGD
jgi:hypothetical protein